MKKLTALIVDDEELARISLKQVLVNFPNIEICGEAYNLNSAIEAVNKLNPDIVFLDIGLPGESGFSLLEHIKIPTKIVFITAYDEYAIQAFEVNACDYLLKPVSIQRLQNTLERIGHEDSPSLAANTTYQYHDQIFLEVNYKYHFVRVDTIIRIISAGKYSEILTTNKLKGLVKKSMQEWEKCLPANEFLRIHRATIINIAQIEKIERNLDSIFEITLKDIEKPYRISRSYAKQITKIFDK